MKSPEIQYKIIRPDSELSAFVESFWMLKNVSDKAHEIVVLPDGRFDIIFSYSGNEEHDIVLRGLDTMPAQNSIPPRTVMFAVSFKLLAIEYLLDIKAASVLNEGALLPADFWDISKNDLDDFEAFCKKVSAKMITQIKPDIDGRKQKLFELIYASNGALPVKELSEKVYWSSRQINRYFKEQFGISLKAYCNILRFKASLQHIKEGKLYPEEDFADQNHFIKEIKKFSGVVPKELFKNQNDRFILLSTLPVK
ncbi:helix-turn-helix transcriptional regulator [Taibaiella lutea]|uniref:Helix-turn-helix transcriptional regulator n=1 Tax=Taibaiella lutea TaxID=2608001 RepID=A0A5M6CHD3_9BACT|nr:AraC family transcriptional regulator [Taibaiella lutea]KAA5534457.1 helix-turn-helix transcriptional regulator [Taibaiella lutea]